MNTQSRGYLLGGPAKCNGKNSRAAFSGDQVNRAITPLHTAIATAGAFWQLRPSSCYAVDGLVDAFGEFQTTSKEVNELKQQVDQIELRLNRPRLGGGGIAPAGEAERHRLSCQHLASRIYDVRDND